MRKYEHPRTDLYRAEREKGLTYQQIADKHGVSKQCIAQACGKQSVARFRYNNSCIYLGLRRWINDNKITTGELLRRMDVVLHTKNYRNIQDILYGRKEPKKSDIDQLIEITGMTYEELFREVDDAQE
jgi:transcriptional regulator with XRE-family HTH domain